MSDAPTVGTEPEEVQIPIMTKRDMLKALEGIGMDDSIIVAVYPPNVEDEGFSETETPGATPEPDDDEEDDREYLECKILDSEVVEPEDPTDPDMVGKKALLLTVDMDAEDDDTEEDGEEANEPA